MEAVGNGTAIRIENNRLSDKMRKRKRLNENITDKKCI